MKLLFQDIYLCSKCNKKTYHAVNLTDWDEQNYLKGLSICLECKHKAPSKSYNGIADGIFIDVMK